MISLKDIYDDLDVSSNFSLLSFQPSSLEEEIKYENRVQDMDDKLKLLKTMIHGILLLYQRKNISLVWNGCTRKSWMRKVKLIDLKQL